MLREAPSTRRLSKVRWWAALVVGSAAVLLALACGERLPPDDAPPPDGGTSSDAQLGDGALVTDGGFCTPDDSTLFCTDFERAPVETGWTKPIVTGDGTIDLDDASFVSPTNAFLSSASTTTGIATLFRSAPVVPRSFELDFDFRMEPGSESIARFLTLRVADTAYVRLSSLMSDAAQTHGIYVKTSVAGVDSDSLATTLPPLVWAHCNITVRPTEDGGGAA